VVSEATASLFKTFGGVGGGGRTSWEAAGDEFDVDASY
jgi:hypothetical protein